jgi:hypothetical protein
VSKNRKKPATMLVFCFIIASIRGFTMGFRGGRICVGEEKMKQRKYISVLEEKDGKETLV